jgi:transposase
LHGWVTALRTRFPEGKIAVALEQSRGAVIYALMDYDFLLLYPIPPKTLARYREAFALSGAKSDPGDAGLLLELVQTHRDRLRAWQPDDERTRQLRLLTEFRRKTVDERTRLTNELTDRLKSYFPQARDWAGDLRSPSACEFLRRWPTLQAVQQARRTELQQFYHDHRRLSTEEREKLFTQITQAQPLTRDRALVEASALMAQAVAEQLATVLAVIGRLEDELQKLFSQHPEHDLFEGLPGAGAALAPRLAVAFGSDATGMKAPRTFRSSPALPRSPRRAARRSGCTGGGPARNSSARRSTSSPVPPAKSRSGLELTTSESGKRVITTTRPSARWHSSGSGSSTAAGRTAPLMMRSDTRILSNAMNRGCGLRRCRWRIGRLMLDLCPKKP